MRARLVLVLVAAVALGLPAGAAAREKPSPHSVRVHVRAANKALKTVKTIALTHRGRAGRKAVKSWRRHMRIADRQARRLARHRTRRGVKALREVGVADDRCADVISEVVDELGGTLQLDAAKLLDACIGLREKVIATLEGLVDKVPAEYRPLVTDAIVALSAGGEDDIAALTEALGAAGLPADVEDLLKQALEQATQAVHQAVQQLGELASLVGDPAEIDDLQAQLQQLLDELLSPAGSPPASGGGDPPSLPDLPPDLLELLLGALG